MAGAPTKYQYEYPEQAYKLCLMGATDEDLAKFFEVCEATINNWKNDYPEFLESIKKGKEISDADIAHSLFERAMGWMKAYQEDVLTKSGEVVTLNKMAVFPPDTTAAIFWLKNRQKKNWRDKQEIDIGNIDGTAIEVTLNL